MIVEWNNLDPRFRKSNIFSVFKTNILKFIQPASNSHNPRGICLITILRISLSHLREDKFKHGFQDTIHPLCTSIHPLYTSIRPYIHRIRPYIHCIRPYVYTSTVYVHTSTVYVHTSIHPPYTSIHPLYVAEEMMWSPQNISSSTVPNLLT